MKSNKTTAKKSLSLMLTLLMVLSCLMVVQPTTVQAASKKYVKSLNVSTKVSVAAGSKKTVKVTVKVSGKASNKVTVKSSNKKIVKASYSAKSKKITLSGVKKGTAKVTVKTVDKNKKGKQLSKTIKVTVTKKTATTEGGTTVQPTTEKPKDDTKTEKTTTIAVTSVSLSETTTTILKGNSRQLLATVVPNNATDPTLAWSSSVSAVATVDANGLVKAVSAGTSVITATNAASGKKAACTVTVVDEVTVSTQEELNQALSSSYIGKIIIQTESGAKLTIPSGSYPGVDLVIQADAGSEITNNGQFGSVSISGGTYHENATVNSLLVTGDADVTIGQDSSVDVVVAVAENASAAKIALTNQGTISNLALNSAGTVTINGTSSNDLSVPVSVSASGVTLKTSQNVNVNATAKATLVLTGDTDKTSVTVNTKDNVPSVYGVGFIPCSVTDTNEQMTLVAEASEDLAPVDIQGLVKDAYTGDILSDVAVYLIPYTDYTEGMTLSEDWKSATDESGKYLYKEAKSGNYYLVMQKEGYKEAIQLLTASSQFNSVYQNEVMELLDASKEDNATASISGSLKDAASGASVAGITVELRKNKGNIIGTAIKTVTTDENGAYSFGDLTADQYTVYYRDNRQAEDEKYISLSKNVCVKADQNVSMDATLSKPIKGSGIRFVLTWGSKAEGVPDDLDTHLLAPTVDGGYREIWYGAKFYSIGNQVYAMLDVDETEYNGPETATILSDLTGVYYYYVYNYAEDGNLPTSQARVDVYSGNELLTSYNVPSMEANTGNWWKVCSYNSVSGDVVAYNSILDELDLAQSYTRDSADYIEGVTGSAVVDWIIRPYSTKSSYEYPVASRIGLKITGTTTADWSTVRQDLEITVTEGYTYTWGEGTEEDVAAVLNIMKDGKKVGYYNVYYTPAYIKTVSGSYYVMGFDEFNNSVFVYYSYYMSGSLNWNDVQFEFADGYTGQIISGEEDDILQIKDSSGTVVAEKKLYSEPRW